jgi:hypothetical protein
MPFSGSCKSQNTLSQLLSGRDEDVLYGRDVLGTSLAYAFIVGSSPYSGIHKY